MRWIGGKYWNEQWNGFLCGQRRDSADNSLHRHYADRFKWLELLRDGHIDELNYGVFTEADRYRSEQHNHHQF
jgi:hypothetical protein